MTQTSTVDFLRGGRIIFTMCPRAPSHHLHKLHVYVVLAGSGIPLCTLHVTQRDYTKLMDVLIHNIQTKKRKNGKPDEAKKTSKRLKEAPQTAPLQEKNVLLQNFFLHACKENNLNNVRYCLSVKDLDINCDSALWTPLMFACIGGHDPVVRELCSHQKIMINQKDAAGLTALHHATKNHSSIVKILAKSRNIDLNAKDKDGLTPVHHAIVNQTLESIKVLRQFPGVDWNIASNVGTPLVMALTSGRAEILRVILTVPEINLSLTPACIKKTNHKTIGEMAVKSLASNAAQCVEVLAKHTKVDWNVRDHLGDTPIMHAYKQQKMEVVKVLLRTPGVDLSEIRRQDFTMFQTFLFDAIEVHSNKLSGLQQKVPECPVSLRYNYGKIRNFSSFFPRFVTTSSGQTEPCSSARAATWSAASVGPS